MTQKATTFGKVGYGVNGYGERKFCCDRCCMPFKSDKYQAHNCPATIEERDAMSKKPPKRIEPADLCKTGLEHGEQSALICWCALPDVQEQYPDAIKLFAINNNVGHGEKKNAIGARRGQMARMSGTKAGVYDLFLPVARHGFHGLFVEMKVRKLKPKTARAKKGGCSDEQIAFAEQVTADGFANCVCYGWEEAAQALMSYLS